MIFRELYLFPSLNEFPRELTSRFRYQSRSACSFLERVLKEEKFKTENFRRLCVVCCRNPAKPNWVNASNVLIVEVPFCEEEYNATAKEDLNEYFLGLLASGFSKCSESIPNDKLLEGIEKFRQNGNKNEWDLKSKFLRHLGIKWIIRCKLTLDDFILVLLLFKNGQQLFEEEILRTKPDEVFFAEHLRRIKFSGDSIVLSDYEGKDIYRKDLRGVEIQGQYAYFP